MSKVRRRISVIMAFVMSATLVFTFKPAVTSASPVALLAEISLHILADQTVEFIKMQATGEAAEQEAMMEQVHEISEMTPEILETVEEMESMITRLNTTVNYMQEDIDELKYLIENGFAESEYNDVIKSLEEVDNYLDVYWQSYQSLAEDLANPDSEIYSDEDERDKRIDEVMTMIHEAYSGNVTYATELNKLYTQMSGTMSLVDARIAVDKVNLPFEHQIYDNAVSALNYGVSIQAKLLHLYWEVTDYMQTKYASTPNLLPSVYSSSSYDSTVDSTVNRINEECEHEELHSLMTPSDIDTSVVLTASTGLDYEIPAYRLIVNATGAEFYVAKKSYTIDELVGWPISNYETTMGEPQMQTPQTIQELMTLIPRSVDNPVEWMQSQGNLSFTGTIDVFTMGVEDSEGKATYAHATSSTGDTDATLTLNVDMYNNSFDETSVFLHSRDGNMDPNEMGILPIYVNRSSGSGDVPKESEDVYKPTLASQIPSHFALYEGETLDLSALNSTTFAKGTEIAVYGDVLITGGAHGMTVSDLKISIMDNGDDFPYLTLENLNIISTSGGDEYVVGSKAYYAQLDIVGDVSIVTKGVPALHFEQNSATSVFGIDQASLTLERQDYGPIIHSNDTQIGTEMSFLDLTLKNLSTNNIGYHDGDGITADDCAVIHMQDCNVDIFQAPLNVSEDNLWREYYHNSVRFDFQHCNIGGDEIFGFANNNGSTFDYNPQEWHKVNLTVGTDRYDDTGNEVYASLVKKPVGSESDRGSWITYDLGTTEDYTLVLNKGEKVGLERIHDLIDGPVSYLQLNKTHGDINGFNGVKFSSITSEQWTTDTYSDYGSYYIDDAYTHELYPLNTQKQIETRYFRYQFTSQLRNSTPTTPTSLNSMGLTEAQLNGLKEHLASIDSNTVVNYPLLTEEISTVDGELLTHLALGSGTLSLSLYDGNQNHIQLMFDAEEITHTPDTFHVGYNVYEADDIQGLPSGATVIEFANPTTLSGLKEVIFNTSGNMQFGADDKYEVYKITNGSAEKVEVASKVNEGGQLKLAVENMGTYAFVRLQDISPATGE